MTNTFSAMNFELKTERLYLSMWEESDASWYRELVGERGVAKPTLEAALKNVISLRERDGILLPLEFLKRLVSFAIIVPGKKMEKKLFGTFVIFR